MEPRPTHVRALPLKCPWQAQGVAPAQEESRLAHSQVPVELLLAASRLRLACGELTATGTGVWLCKRPQLPSQTQDGPASALCFDPRLCRNMCALPTDVI